MTGFVSAISEDLRAFWRAEDGVAMTEALVVFPFLTFMAAGVLEFGSIFWQRQQIETGLRDAARYLARCRTTTNFHTVAECEAAARNLAYYGNVAGTPPLRVPTWNTGVTFTYIVEDPPVPPPRVTVRAQTSHTFIQSPIIGWLGIGNDGISITTRQDQKVIGW